MGKDKKKKETKEQPSSQPPKAIEEQPMRILKFSQSLAEQDK